MLTVEVRVNGNIVAELQALNITSPGFRQRRSSEFAVNSYRYGGSVHPIDETAAMPAAFSGNVEHKRTHGILKLVRLILEDLE